MMNPAYFYLGLRLALALALASLLGCEQRSTERALAYRQAPASASTTVYRFAVHPLHNPKKLFQAYQPLVDVLNRQLAGAHIELEASRDYQAYEQKIREREPEFLLPNPWQTLQAIKFGYHVVAMAGDADDFKGLFIVRKDSTIQQPADLKGKVVSYPSPTALAAAVMPQYYLYKQGIDVRRDIQNNYVGSQESSIMNVYLGQSAVGATWPPPWRLFQKDHPAEAAQLQVLWQTPSLVNNSVMVRDDVPSNIAALFKKTLLELAQTQQGKAILAGIETARFHAADDANYDSVREYIARFEKNVRPVEEK
jgi:phosphonate transport system substrate-binding protein